MLKKLMPRSLFGRSLLILVVPVVIVQLVTSYVFFDRHWDRVTSRLSDAVAGEVALLIENLENAPNEQARDDVTSQAIRHLDMALFLEDNAKIRRQTHQTTTRWEKMVAAIFIPVFEARVGRPFVVRFDFADKWVYLDVQLNSAVLHISLPERRLFSSSGYIYLLWVFGSAMLLLLVAIMFMRNQVRPIRKLAAAAERLGRGQELSFFKPEGAREVRQAGQAFLDMAQRIKRQIEQRTLMLAGVSHDLRTPITRLRLSLSMMPDTPDLKDMRSDLDDMERMISGYLDFARGEGDEKSQNLKLESLLQDVVSAHSKTETPITLAVKTSVVMPLKPMAFTRCLGNIISNAQRYGQHVWISATQDHAGDEVTIIVEDDGPGLDRALYEDVFKPFFRADESRSQNKTHGSVGLGLSIAMDIIHAHGGQIHLQPSRSHGGLAVHIKLPL